MAGWLGTLSAWLAQAPIGTVCLLVGVAAFVENLFPPIPADVIVLLGAVLAGRQGGSVALVAVVVWVCNVAGALLVYWLGRRYGATFFGGRWGRLILQPQQLVQLDRFYQRHGVRIVFVSRFLPMFRAVVPVFAGVAHLGPGRAALAIAAASAVWYGLLVYLGAAAGRNWQEVVGLLSASGRWLGLAAGAIALVVLWWWWRSRTSRTGTPDD